MEKLSKKTKKIQEEKESIIKEELSLDTKCLSDAELSKLNSFYKDRLYFESNIENYNLKIQNKMYQIELIKNKIKEEEITINSLKIEKDNASKRYQDNVNEYRELLKSIKEKHNLKNENFGYDPDSGSIIENE